MIFRPGVERTWPERGTQVLRVLGFTGLLVGLEAVMTLLNQANGTGRFRRRPRSIPPRTR